MASETVMFMLFGGSARVQPRDYLKQRLLGNFFPVTPSMFRDSVEMTDKDCLLACQAHIGRNLPNVRR